MGSQRTEVVAGLDPVREELRLRPILSQLLVAAVVLTASSCVGEARGTPAGEATIDRALPMSEMIAAFNRGQPEVLLLEGGAESRDALVAEFVAAVERGDSLRIGELAVTRSEYGQLYFPTSRYTQPPYELPPEVAWMLSSAASEKGVRRVLLRLGGHDLGFQSHVCADSAVEGGNRFWRECNVTYLHPGEGQVRRRLFGTIIERQGRFKILSYANDF